MPAKIYRRLFRGALICTALLIGSISSSNHRTIAAVKNQIVAENSPEPTYFYQQEVRLRRLHLARPDLIRYPIAYEEIC